MADPRAIVQEDCTTSQLPTSYRSSTQLSKSEGGFSPQRTAGSMNREAVQPEAEGNRQGAYPFHKSMQVIRFCRIHFGFIVSKIRPRSDRAEICMMLIIEDFVVLYNGHLNGAATYTAQASTNSDDIQLARTHSVILTRSSTFVKPIKSILVLTLNPNKSLVARRPAV